MEQPFTMKISRLQSHSITHMNLKQIMLNEKIYQVTIFLSLKRGKIDAFRTLERVVLVSEGKQSLGCRMREFLRCC